ncbi:hypothetical protein KKB83_04790, partial [Patescibacteria group bacterium]|nr:hypothetical protein [Patescibacteria group bacterium]
MSIHHSFFTNPLFVISAVVFIIVLALGIFFFVGQTPPAENIIWGINFSQKHATNFGFDWKEVFLSLIDDLGAQNIKIATYWDLIEQEKDSFDFTDIDWQMKQAEDNGVQVTLVIGMKT